MMEWINRFRGYVKIRVWGFAPQRFMNLCSNKGILLWNIDKQDEIYTMCVSLKSFYQLRPVARKTKVRVVISERCGLPFLVPEMLHRKAFLTGLLLAVIFWSLSSLFVWDIQVSGNYQVTDDLFFQFLTEEGIRPGMRRSELNIGELEKQIRRTFPQIIWISGRLDGTRLLIELKENDTVYLAQPREKLTETSGNLVAEYDGTVTGIIVRSGVPRVSAGSSVTKGDVLVEGKIPIYAEDGTVREYQLVNADADIVMEHSTAFQIFLPVDYIKKKYTGREKKCIILHFGGREWGSDAKIPFLDYDSVLDTYPIKILEYLHFPCTIGRITYREYQKTEYCYTAPEAKSILQKKISDFLESLNEKGVQIISKDVKIETKTAGWKVKGKLTVRETAGMLVDSSAEETEDSGAEEIDRNED